MVEAEDKRGGEYVAVHVRVDGAWRWSEDGDGAGAIEAMGAKPEDGDGRGRAGQVRSVAGPCSTAQHSL